MQWLISFSLGLVRFVVRVYFFASVGLAFADQEFYTAADRIILVPCKELKK